MVISLKTIWILNLLQNLVVYILVVVPVIRTYNMDFMDSVFVTNTVLSTI